MRDIGEISEDRVLSAVRGTLDGMPLPDRPATEAIVAAGRTRRRRRIARMTGAGAAGVVGIAAAVLAVTGALGGAGAPAASGGPGASQVAAFTLVSNSDGTSTLTISPRALFEPGPLEAALAAHGIPAIVTSGKFCSSEPAPASLNGIVTQLGSKRPSAGQRSLIIDPSAMPAGTELSIGYFVAGRVQSSFVTLVRDGAYTCTRVSPAGRGKTSGVSSGQGTTLGVAWLGR